MALWSEQVSSDVKMNIAKAILVKADFTEAMPLGPPKFPKLTPNTSLTDLIGPKSSAIFRIYSLHVNFLKSPVQNWEESADYQRAQSIFSCIKVTNDTAERYIKLISDLFYCIGK